MEQPIGIVERLAHELRRDRAVDDLRQRAVARQAVGEPGQAALALHAHQEELPVAHDPGAEHDGHRELVEDPRRADAHDAIDVRRGAHAVRYPSSHMMV